MSEFIEGSLLGDKYTIAGQVNGCALALCSETDSQVLIKKISLENGSLENLQEQVQKTSKFTFDSFLPVLSVFENEGEYFIVSKYEASDSLESRIERGNLDVEEALSLVMPLADSLEQAWKTENMAHGSISPLSVLVDEDMMPSLLSFSGSQSQSPVYAGFNDDSIMDFIAPELREGGVANNKGDMYSIGALLFYMMTSSAPDSGAKLTGDYPGVLITLVNDLLEINPDHRPHNWQTVIMQATKVFDAMHAPEDSLTQSSGIENTEKTEDVIEPGTIVGNGFEVDAKIAEGSMGDIYTAYREDDDLFVQVKVLPAHLTDDAERFQRFLREIELTASLKHPNLLSVVEYGNEFNGRHYIVTEYEKSITLESYIGRYAPLPEEEAVSLIKQIGEVLAYGWNEKKVLHRDIKPKNILVNEQTKTAKLTDFGIAKSMDSQDDANLTGVGYTVGTPEYMSPEQVRAEEDLDFRSDLYALGLVLYEALTGQKAFDDKNPMMVMQKQLNEAPKEITSLNSAASSSAVALCNKMLSKDRNDRHDSWSSLFEQMDTVVGGEQSVTSQAPVNMVSSAVPSSSVSSEDKKSNMIPVIIGLVVVVGAILAFVILK